MCVKTSDRIVLMFRQSYVKYILIEPSIDFGSQFATMENDPLKQLTDFFKSEGYVGKEAVEEAMAELDKRRKENLS